MSSQKMMTTLGGCNWTTRDVASLTTTETKRTNVTTHRENFTPARLRRVQSNGKPKYKQSHGCISSNSTALPVEIRNDRMFSEKPAPAKTTRPGIGHASMS